MINAYDELPQEIKEQVDKSYESRKTFYNDIKNFGEKLIYGTFVKGDWDELEKSVQNMIVSYVEARALLCTYAFETAYHKTMEDLMKEHPEIDYDKYSEMILESYIENNAHLSSLIMADAKVSDMLAQMAIPKTKE